MSSFTYPLKTPFDSVTGDLLPAYRDAYLQGQLTPTVAHKVEVYLRSSPIQRGIVLGRHHELEAAARQRGTTLATPHWVQHELLLQPSASNAGPLHRPAVRIALALFTALCLASGVQWLRNKPLVPAPVAAAVTRVAASAAAATGQLVQRFTRPAGPVAAASRPVRPTRPVASVATMPTPAPKPRETAQTDALAPMPAAVPPLPLDSLAEALPVALPTATATAKTAAGTLTAAAPTAANSVVRGRVSDALGKPLAGATVLIMGSRQGTSTDAAGNYVLNVLAGATLQFGYAGYNDLLRSATLGTMNVTLQPDDNAGLRRSRERN